MQCNGEKGGLISNVCACVKSCIGTYHVDDAWIYLETV